MHSALTLPLGALLLPVAAPHGFYADGTPTSSIAQSGGGPPQCDRWNEAHRKTGAGLARHCLHRSFGSISEKVVSPSSRMSSADRRDDNAAAPCLAAQLEVAVRPV